MSRLNEFSNLSNSFSYNGFADRKSYLINLGKRKLGLKSVSLDDQLDRVNHVNYYYKLHPDELNTYGKSESKRSLVNKINEVKKSRYSTSASKYHRSVTKLDDSISKSAKKYHRGDYYKYGVVASIPLIPVPIIGISAITPAVGVVADAIKLKSLSNNNNSIKVNYNKYKLNKKSVINLNKLTKNKSRI